MFESWNQYNGDHVDDEETFAELDSDEEPETSIYLQLLDSPRTLL